MNTKTGKKRFILTLGVWAGFIVLTQAQNDAFIMSPQSVYMGTIPISSSSSQEIFILNNSINSVEITEIAINGPDAADFKILDNPSTYSMAPFDELLLEIVYTPTTADQDIALFQFQSGAETWTDTLTGYGSEILNGQRTFERILGSSGVETNGKSVQPTVDGGYIIVGEVEDEDLDVNEDYFVLKTDENGREEWIQSWGDIRGDAGIDVLVLNDGNYIFLGQTDIAGKLSDIMLSKLDSQGNIVWEKHYGSNLDEEPSRLIHATDGGYIICGITDETGSANAHVMKTDSEGNVEWNKNYGGPYGESAYDITMAHDGGYVFVGYYQEAYSPDIYLVKIDASGNEVWSKKLGGDNPDEGHAISRTNDGGYIISGYTTGENAKDGYLLKVNANGEEEWTRSFGGPHSDAFSSVIQTPDGGYLCAGSINQYFSLEFIYDDLYLVKTDSEGNLTWERQFGGSLNESASRLICTSGGNFAVVGQTTSFTSLGKLYFLQLNENGMMTHIKRNESSAVIPGQYSLLQNYPNPFNPSTTIEFSLVKTAYTTLSIYNILGQRVAVLVNKELTPGTYQFTFDASKLSSGTYFYKLKSDRHSKVKKMLLLR